MHMKLLSMHENFQKTEKNRFILNGVIRNYVKVFLLQNFIINMTSKVYFMKIKSYWGLMPRQTALK